MKIKFFPLLLLSLGLMLFIIPAGHSQTLPKAKLPVLTTSAGQSPDVTTVNIILEEAGIGYDYCDVPTVEILAAGVGLGGRESGVGFHAEVHTDLTRFPQGTPYRTVIFAIGASLKGMGASGLTVEAEEARLKKLLEYCQANKIFTIGVHIGGESKRGAAGSDNERMIEVVAPNVNYLIVTKDGNKDGRFTDIARKKNIPLTEVDYALDVVEIFKKVFE
ncbi:MAG TPA: DUF6305 family protein [Candidatus Saccharicenans sp.]|jgi:hypothetical protein|nr:DUF6305 family protein [Candidatus Saccharicenans sp.]HOJ26174.1 DUF6305 family protein [Candidatus Saccharicenans sp.]HOL44967.1 DUF6305 family protein [Candidatus Saccharicenans sp.]HOM93611.1 DUF6305 family protein [Candidatus Saccharicenans sp.]HOT68263.1 DUF6305 family protein [Candidatus Saccharicenans sp.]